MDFLPQPTASNPALGHKQSKPSCRQTFLFLPLLFWQRLVLLCGFSHEWRVPRAVVRSQAGGGGWQRGLRRSRPLERGLQALGVAYMTHTCVSEPFSLCCVSSLPQEVAGTCGERCWQWLCNTKPQSWVLLPFLWHWQGRKFHGHFGAATQQGGWCRGCSVPGQVPALALSGVTCQRKSLKDRCGWQREDAPELQLHGASPVPGKDALHRICGAGEGVKSQVPNAAGCAVQSSEHPAPWCQFWTPWDVQGDASRQPCVPTAMAAVLGLLEKQRSKPQAFLAGAALAFCLQLISSWF